MIGADSKGGIMIDLGGNGRWGIMIAVAVATSLLAPQPTLAATTWRVDDDNCPRTGDGSKDAPYCTIAEALTASSDGDRIVVAPGTYPEHLLITKSVIIRGAQSGKKATKRSNPLSEESVVGSNLGGFQLAGNNITIDGFTVRGVTSGVGAGIQTSANSSGYVIENNIIENNQYGINLRSKGEFPTTVQHNVIRANNISGPRTGNGILSDTTLINARLRSNRILGHSSSSMILVGNQSNLRIEDNTLEGTGFVASNLANSTLSGNSIANITGTGMFLNSNNSGLTIKSNQLTTGTLRGISIGNVSSPTTNTNLTIQKNTISGFGGDGIRLASTVTESLIKSNEISQSGRDGIHVQDQVTDVEFTKNKLHDNTTTDATDLTVGTVSFGTANLWDKNKCTVSLPAAICSEE
jgi:hypothetical protein